MICVSLPSEDSMAWRKSASESFVDSLDASFCESGGELGDCGALVFGLPVSGFCANAGAINSDKAIKPANSNFDFTGSSPVCPTFICLNRNKHDWISRNRGFSRMLRINADYP